MVRALIHIVLLCALALDLSASNRHDTPTTRDLVGRWRSDTARTGYWIIDRYANGRYAKRQYLDFDYAKPAELTLEWGRWKLGDGHYSETIQGTTSPTLKQFLGDGLSWKILDFQNARFSFESHDGQPRIEKRVQADTPLLQIKTPPPADAAKKQLIDTISGSHERVPSWINSAPKRTASNQTMQPTAGRRTASLSDD
jgi:hypothetical protein